MTQEEKLQIMTNKSDQIAYNQNNLVLRMNVHILALNFLFRVGNSVQVRFKVVSLTTLVMEAIAVMLMGTQLFLDVRGFREDKKQHEL